ncbi:hypothetical protein HUG17_7103 [Dermatophagoides farinae]|uniref:UDP-glycosyltransferase n=1 Tax=Dermatophagoides farinae TaxID=6954 RepID=A0A9D4NS25_DERFA|nr:uncharacterized UDP-glucosyltransferase YjiC-like [Dermatophagoides farinae]KAH7636897.1 hypothetical protein HUG17_7103 [Dermatophagoides farinae]
MSPTINTNNKRLKIFFCSVDGVGHINACIGMAQALAKRGHQIYFLNNRNFISLFEKFGFNEIVLGLKSAASDKSAENKVIDENNHPVKDVELNDIFAESGLLSGKSSYDQLDLFDRNKNDRFFCETMYNDLRNIHEEMANIIEKEKPDLIIVDYPLVAPCIAYGKIPWAFSWSGNPIPIYHSEKLPPFTSGYPTYDKTGWAKFKAKYDQTIELCFEYYQNLLNEEFGGPKITSQGFFMLSPYMNLYGYPEELDYTDIVTLPDNYIRVDAFCRELTETFKLPEEFKVQPSDKLIYLSMGSIGSSNVQLIRKITATLAKTPYKYIVSKGQHHEQIELPANMWGRAYLPQTKILPLVDMVITHGGNNTVTETFYFGKPMLVMPLFGDQFDNAQRIQEKGFGYRINSHHYVDNELIEMIHTILDDKKMIEKCCQAGERLRRSDSKQKACEKIELLLQRISF